jgi:hypothetical protein
VQTDDLENRDGQLRTLEITPRERQLVLKYGYPFPEAEQPLRNSRAVGGYHRVQIDAYWIEMMVADLSRSARGGVAAPCSKNSMPYVIC